MIAFIDTEVSVQSKKAMDYGAVREDGAVLHTRNKAEFLSFVEDCEAVAGHNIIGFDLKHTDIKGRHLFIDTLYLSPLLFPNKPYHHLVKDDKLQVDELNSPVNDAKKAQDHFKHGSNYCHGGWKYITCYRTTQNSLNMSFNISATLWRLPSARFFDRQ